VSSCCREADSVDRKADPRVRLINAPALRRSRPARIGERQKRYRRQGEQTPKRSDIARRYDSITLCHAPI
jgi:hypothetical protein